MKSNKLNAKDLLEIASSQWASAKDIMIIGSVGRNKAYAIRNEIISPNGLIDNFSPETQILIISIFFSRKNHFFAQKRSSLLAAPTLLL